MIKLIVLYIFFILFKKMSLHKQDQHKLPQVYLKKFGLKVLLQLPIFLILTVLIQEFKEYLKN